MADTSTVFSLIKSSNFSQLQLVLESDDNINCRNERQETPLMSAMLSLHDHVKRANVVRMLIDLGADVNVQNLRGQTPLMYACILDQSDTLSTLINCDATQPNTQDVDGNTGLMYACALGNKDAVRVMTEVKRESIINLDMHASNREGITAFIFARDNFHDDIVQLLVSAGVPGSPCPSLASLDESQAHWRSTGHQCGSTVRPNVTEAAEFVTHKLEEIKCVNNDSGDGGSLKVEHSSGDRKVKETSEFHSTLKILNEQDTVTPIINDVALEKFFASKIKNYKSSKRTCTNGKSTDGNTSSEKELKTMYRPSTNDFTDPFPTPRTDTSENGRQVKEGFGDEYAIYDKLYSVEFLMGNGPSENNAGSSSKESNNDLFAGFLKTSDRMNEKPNCPADASTSVGTGKLNFFKLTTHQRAKILGRTIWSIYGEPLPPIPVKVDAMERVVDGISKIRRHLGKSHLQTGRLLSLDPDLWCLLESIRTNLRLSKQDSVTLRM